MNSERDYANSIYEDMARHYRESQDSAAKVAAPSPTRAQFSLRWAVETVHDAFQKDEAQGYHAKDRQFAISILGKALEQNPPSEDAATTADLRQALQTAIGHLDHMAAWITAQKAGYSFESLGEDMPGIRAALGKDT